MRDFQMPGRSPVIAANGMCATSHPLAAKVAVQTLEAGGNAVDAALAGAVLLGICEPQMTGIGGDLFALIKPAGEERIVALNGSGKAPHALNAADLRAGGHSEVPEKGPESITIPGAVDAICTLANDYGLLGLEAVLSPAIRYAEEGVPVAPRVARDWSDMAASLKGSARDFYLISGRAPKQGEIFRHAMQADVLRRIAKDGRTGFYEGEVAKDLVTSLQEIGGTHSLADLANTRCDYTTPISGQYKGVELVEHPPNGQGAAAILMNNILAEFDLPAMNPIGATRAHIEAEAKKLAYDARDRLIADQSHTDQLDYFLAAETAKDFARQINLKEASDLSSTPAGAVHKDTVYITVIDKDRMAVSLIYSIFAGFGSGFASSKFGILFHNRGSGFTLSPGHPNEIGPGKRPMHTIIPGMLRQNGRLMSTFGVMGGHYQANGHARFVTNLVDYEMDPQTAIDAPRAFFDKGELQLERGYTDTVAAELAELGHKVARPKKGIGGAQAIRIDHENCVLEGGSDPRKDGCALGY